jgi:hypothetical protein
VRHNLTEEDILSAQNKGWKPIDVRLLEGADGVKAALEGVRIGSIELDKEDRDALRDEARVYGLLSTKGDKSTKKSEFLDGATLQEMLEIGGGRADNRDNLNWFVKDFQARAERMREEDAKQKMNKKRAETRRRNLLAGARNTRGVK